jgi:hypothetical protein
MERSFAASSSPSGRPTFSSAGPPPCLCAGAKGGAAPSIASCRTEQFAAATAAARRHNRGSRWPLSTALRAPLSPLAVVSRCRCRRRPTSVRPRRPRRGASSPARGPAAGRTAALPASLCTASATSACGLRWPCVRPLPSPRLVALRCRPPPVTADFCSGARPPSTFPRQRSAARKSLERRARRHARRRCVASVSTLWRRKTATRAATFGPSWQAGCNGRRTSCRRRVRTGMAATRSSPRMRHRLPARRTSPGRPTCRARARTASTTVAGFQRRPRPSRPVPRAPRAWRPNKRGRPPPPPLRPPAMLGCASCASRGSTDRAGLRWTRFYAGQLHRPLRLPPATPTPRPS